MHVDAFSQAGSDKVANTHRTSISFIMTPATTSC